MEPAVVKAAAQLLIDEVRSILGIYSILGEIPKDRLEGIHEHIKLL